MRAYLPDEVDHASLRALLLEGDEPVISSELARLEFASAAHAAARAHRLSDPGGVLARFDEDCGPRGALSLVLFRPGVVLPTAHRIVREHPLRTLAAIHLAVAIEDGVRLAEDGEVTFVTRDEAQATAACSLGLGAG